MPMTDGSSRLTLALSGVILMAAVALMGSQPLPARAAIEEFGQLSVVREHMNWPSPESVVRDLNSQNANVRFKALRSIGVPDKLARRPIYNSATPATVIGAEVVKAEQIELRYAALGSDETRQAIVVAQVVGAYAYAAVVTPKSNGWERIALFNCWW
jgi:hypothetical protein